MEEILIDMLVLPTYQSLIDSLKDPESRTRWGVIAQPILYGFDWCLPVGWEDELEKSNIPFEKKTITIQIITE